MSIKTIKLFPKQRVHNNTYQHYMIIETESET